MTPKRKKHVFIFLEIFSREGGIQSYIKDIFEAYLSLGSHQYQGDVFLLRDAPSFSHPLQSSHLKFHYCKSQFPWLGRGKLTLFLLIHLFKQRPDRVFCGHVYLVPLVQLLCQPLGIPYTVLTYGKEVWNPLPSLQYQGLHHASDIWTISRYSGDRIGESNNIPKDKIRFLPCVVDGNRFMPGEKSPDLIQKYHLEDAKVLMTVARLWPKDAYKGVDITIQALPTIRQVFPEVKYLIIGRGEDQPRLRQLAQDLGVAAQVIFAGFVATEDLPAHYHLADAYIMPSQEGFGIVYLEALASGVPVLGGDNDGSADPLQDGQLGWQVPHRDSEAVAAACIQILQGTDPRCQGAWLRKQTLKKFGKEALIQNLQHLLE